jgi:hypothetical protein
MAFLEGLQNVAPAILRFPIEKTVKAIANLYARRKIPSSIGRLVALGVGLALGFFFPQVGQAAFFLLSLLMGITINTAVTIVLSTIASMYLMGTLAMFLTKKGFQFYYNNRYGVSNPEHRLTDRDRKRLYELYADRSEAEAQKEVALIEKRINFLANEIRYLKLKKQPEAAENAKYVLNCLKLGQTTAFETYYEREGAGSGDQRGFGVPSPTVGLGNIGGKPGGMVGFAWKPGGGPVQSGLPRALDPQVEQEDAALRMSLRL